MAVWRLSQSSPDSICLRLHCSHDIMAATKGVSNFRSLTLEPGQATLHQRYHSLLGTSQWQVSLDRSISFEEGARRRHQRRSSGCREEPIRSHHHEGLGLAPRGGRLGEWRVQSTLPHGCRARQSYRHPRGNPKAIPLHFPYPSSPLLHSILLPMYDPTSRRSHRFLRIRPRRSRL